MDLTGKKVLVVGLARTGVALTRFLVQAGARVTVTDLAPAKELAEMRALIQDLPVEEELGATQPAHVLSYDLILPSPGVPPELPWLEEARRHGIPVWGELELAGHFLTRPVMAVSGTNGKTTTTTLVGEFLKASGIKALVGGLFVVEALSVILQVSFFKVTNGRRIFRMAPIHHHFELKGWPEPKVIVRFWIIAIVLGILSLSTLKLR